MTTDQFVAVLGALTALVVAASGLAFQVRSYHREVDGRMSELLELTRTAAHAQGVLQGADPPDSAGRL